MNLASRRGAGFMAPTPSLTGNAETAPDGRSSINKSLGALLLLRRGHRHSHRVGPSGRRALIRKVIAIFEVPIELAGQFGSTRTKRRPSALQEKDRDHGAKRGLRKRGEPAEAGAIVGARSCLAKDRKLAEVGAQPAGGAVLDCAGHTGLHLRQILGDIQGPLYLWLKAGDLYRARRMLQIIQRSPIGERCHEGPKLQRRQRDALAEAAHAPDAAFRD